MRPISEKVFYDLDSQPIANATKVKIIEVSIELFSERGFNGASIRDITKEVGIKESSLYKHFKNKDEILEIIFMNFRKEAMKLLPPMDRIGWIIEFMSVQDFLQRGIENFLQHIDDSINQKVWRIMYIELFRHPMAYDIYMNEIMKRTVDCLTIVFEGMIHKGKIKPLNPGTLAMEYQNASVSMILEYNLLKATGKSTEQTEQLIKEHVRFFTAAASI